VITRYAPTPSGFLHVGNLVNIALTARLAERNDASIVLRIDDADTARVRQAYLDDIFAALGWLDVPWHIGPRGVADLPKWSQHTRHDQYRSAAWQLREVGAAYVCECSRAEWTNWAQGSQYTGSDCPRGCSERNLHPTPGRNALRFAQPGLRHVVLWRREDGPSYHLASIVDDDFFAVDFVVRGADLEESTQIQRAISRALPGSRFHEAHVIHHRLLTDEAGRKLSKSAGHGAQAPERTAELRREVDSWVETLLVA